MNIIFLTRYWLSCHSLMFCIFIMPEGAYKEEFKRRVYGLRDEAMNKLKEDGNET